MEPALKPNRVSHQYVDRATGEVRTEALYADRIVNLVYSTVRERAPAVYRLATGRFASRLLGCFAYDKALGMKIRNPAAYLDALGIDAWECVEPLSSFRTPRDVFERKIRYWDTRPMPEGGNLVVCPADARLLVGSLNDSSLLYVKDKFFRLDELLGGAGSPWSERFSGGDFAIFRLTPDKYHYSHTPVEGRVAAFYTIGGSYHACNPGAVLAEVTPFSKNKRVVTIIDTDVPGGTGVGLVAMIEVVALMIGEVVQRYSRNGYENPRGVHAGMLLHKGLPKSLYRPGSSTDILLFEPGRVRFAADLLQNQRRADVVSRLSIGFGRSLAETDVKVRELLAHGLPVPQERGMP